MHKSVYLKECTAGLALWTEAGAKEPVKKERDGILPCQRKNDYLCRIAAAEQAMFSAAITKM